MKRIFILLVTLVLFIASPALSARKGESTQIGTSIGIGSGIPITPSQLENDFNPSFGALLDVEMQWKNLGASAAADYNFFLSTGLEPQDANILTLFLNLKFRPLTKGGLRPYVLAGAGYFRYWVVDLKLTDNTTGWQFGGGAEIEISKTQRLFIEAKYVEGRTRGTNPQNENTVYVPIRVGLTFLF
jgi:opacity protein-like surface antigen